MSGIKKTPDNIDKYSQDEIRSFLLVILVLSISFTIALFGNINAYRSLFSPIFPVHLIGIIVIVTVSVFTAEVTKKTTARSMESHITYEIWPAGVILTVMTSLLGFVFAVAGRTIIHTNHQERFARWQIELTPKQMALIASLGPMIYLGFAIIFLMLAPFITIQLGEASLFMTAAQVNAILAVSSLAPFSHLDGEKIMRYRFGMWLFSAITALIVLATTLRII